MDTNHGLWAARTVAWDNGEATEVSFVGVFATRRAAADAAKRALEQVADWWHGAQADVAKVTVGVAYTDSEDRDASDGPAVAWKRVGFRRPQPYWRRRAA